MIFSENGNTILYSMAAHLFPAHIWEAPIEDKYVPFIIHMASSMPALLGKLWEEAILLQIQPTEAKQHLGTINM